MTRITRIIVGAYSGGRPRCWYERLRPEQFRQVPLNLFTPEAAIKFGAALGTSAAFWMNLEANYRLHRAMRESDEAQLAAIRSQSELIPSKA